ncbi:MULTISPECIES: hypothetical protein [Sediminibacillus]|nr:hypothetical protein [Sediminibacillus terrae]
MAFLMNFQKLRKQVVCAAFGDSSQRMSEEHLRNGIAVYWDS